MKLHEIIEYLDLPWEMVETEETEEKEPDIKIDCSTLTILSY